MTRLYLMGGVVALILALSVALIIQTKRQQTAHDAGVVLAERLEAANKRAADAEALIRKAQAVGAVQAQEAAIRCQGDGAELFNRGRQVGRAEGAAQCAVP